MRRLFVRITSVLVVIFALANLAAPVLGGMQPSNPALRGFIEGCAGKPQPCWYGIVPGLTHPSEADQLLAAHGFNLIGAGVGRSVYQNLVSASASQQCKLGADLNSTTITNLSIPMCGDVRLGDTALIVGKPEHTHQSGVTTGNGQIAIEMVFTSGLECMELAPYGQIARIVLRQTPPGQHNSVPYRGALPFTWYHKQYYLPCTPIRPPY